MFATVKLVLPYLRAAAIIMIFAGIIYFTCLALSRLSETKNRNYLKWDVAAKIFAGLAFVGAILVVVATIIYIS